MTNASEYPHQYVNGLILNDGWIAYEAGLKREDCPYVDDPSAATVWLHGYDRASDYHRWKNANFPK